MHYVVSYTNPTRVFGSRVEQKCSDKGQVNEILSDAKKYPGSYQNVEVFKITKKGKVRV